MGWLIVMDKNDNLLSDVKQMPNIYKKDMAEWLDVVGKELISVALDSTGDLVSFAFTNGMRFMSNQMIQRVWGIKANDETWYSLLTRSPIKKWKVTKKTQ